MTLLFRIFPCSVRVLKNEKKHLACHDLILFGEKTLEWHLTIQASLKDSFILENVP